MKSPFYRSLQQATLDTPNQELNSFLQSLAGIAASIEPVGSRVTCNPAPTDTDEDWLLLLETPECEKDATPSLAIIDPFAIFVKNGFVQDGDPELYDLMDTGGFTSWRRGNLNIIATFNERFYDLFKLATKLAKRFNLLSKADRKTLFQAVLYQQDVNYPAERPTINVIPDSIAA